MEIADLLNEAMDPEVQEDAASLTQIAKDVLAEWETVEKLAQNGMDKVEDLVEAVRNIQTEQHMNIAKAEREAKKHSEMAERHQKTTDRKNATAAQHDNISKCCATGAIGSAGSLAGAAVAGPAAVSQLPVVGSLVASQAGWFSAAAFTPAAPAAVALLGGAAVVGGLKALGHLSSGQEASMDSNDALELQLAAEQEVAECLGMAEKAKICEQLADAMLVRANAHEEMWEGILLTAQSAADTLSQLKKIDPSSARRKRFNSKMKGFASDLLCFVQACGWACKVTKRIDMSWCEFHG